MPLKEGGVKSKPLKDEHARIVESSVMEVKETKEVKDGKETKDSKEAGKVKDDANSSALLNLENNK